LWFIISAEAGHQNRKSGCNFKESLLPLHFPPGYLPDRQVIDEVFKVLLMSRRWCIKWLVITHPAHSASLVWKSAAGPSVIGEPRLIHVYVLKLQAERLFSLDDLGDLSLEALKCLSIGGHEYGLIFWQSVIDMI
jgi:hypothetical protein